MFFVFVSFLAHDKKRAEQAQPTKAPKTGKKIGKDGFIQFFLHNSNNPYNHMIEYSWPRTWCCVLGQDKSLMEDFILSLTFNPGLVLTSFQATQPRL